MTPGARLSAAIEVLDEVLAGAPVERTLTRWARASRFAGSKDRAAVRDLVYDAWRRRRSALWLSGAGEESGRALITGLLQQTEPQMLGAFDGSRHAPPPLDPAERAALRYDLSTAPAPVAGDYPDFLEPLLRRAFGPELRGIADRLKSRAPVDLRVNTLRADAEGARAALAVEGFVTEPVAGVPTALRVVGNARGVAATQAFRRGLIELQDAASQAVAALAGAAPGLSVLDLCAGGGGKTLALAAAMAGRGRLVAYDAEPRRMKDLPARALRAGAEIEVAGEADLDTGAGFDLVVIDAPCSGSGAWRRDPAQKWRLSPAMLDDLSRTQDALLERGAALAKPGGRLVYMTCSLLVEENEDRTGAFLARFSGADMSAERRFNPGDIGDGFYFCEIKLERNNR